MIVEAFAGWLIEQISDEARKRITDWAFGTEQERSLRRVASAAIAQTATEFSPVNPERAEQIAMGINQVFTTPSPVAPDGHATILEALQAGIAQNLAILSESSGQASYLQPANFLC